VEYVPHWQLLDSPPPPPVVVGMVRPDTVECPEDPELLEPNPNVKEAPLDEASEPRSDGGP